MRILLFEYFFVKCLWRLKTDEYFIQKQDQRLITFGYFLKNISHYLMVECSFRNETFTKNTALRNFLNRNIEIQISHTANNIAVVFLPVTNYGQGTCLETVYCLSFLCSNNEQVANAQNLHGFGVRGKNLYLSINILAIKF